MILCLNDPTDFPQGTLGSDNFSKESGYKIIDKTK